jgi:hypothetical protein
LKFPQQERNPLTEEKKNHKEIVGENYSLKKNSRNLQNVKSLYIELCLNLFVSYEQGIKEA